MTTMTLPLSEILNRLMFEKRIRTAELARKINLPQPTVQRIVTGITPNPHISSLQPIADFFNISIQQLKGQVPIAWLKAQSSQTNTWLQLPLLEWEQASSPDVGKEIAQPGIFTDVNVSTKSFALIVKDSSMEPQFPKGTIIIIDPEKQPRDRSFVIAVLNNHPEAIFRQLLIDGPQFYLKPISPDFDHFKMSLMGANDRILGVLVQARRNYEE